MAEATKGKTNAAEAGNGRRKRRAYNTRAVMLANLVLRSCEDLANAMNAGEEVPNGTTFDDIEMVRLAEEIITEAEKA